MSYQDAGAAQTSGSAAPAVLTIASTGASGSASPTGQASQPVATTNAQTQATAPQALSLRGDDDIQGNILAGFNKDNVAFLFVAFERDGTGAVTPASRAWLASLVPNVATNAEVTHFNEQFSKRRNELGAADPSDMFVTWIGLSFTGGGLRAVGGSIVADTIGSDHRLDVGAAAVAAQNGDSDPTTWLFGHPDAFQPDAIVTVAGDRFFEVEAKWRRIQDRAKAANCEVRVEIGATLPGDKVGHEHFGFKDGVSQPAVFGYDEEDPSAPGFASGSPGVALVHAKQLLVGDGTEQRPGDWTWHGSHMVYRRLVQDVAGFWTQVQRAVDALNEQTTGKATGASTSTDALASKLMGRWRNGAPVALYPDGDPGSIRPTERDNDFRFGSAIATAACPFASHVRKMHPRDDFPGEDHRIIRRGIPFGDPFDPTSTDTARGLHFVCYAASFDAFERLQLSWANGQTPMGSGGQDPIIRTTTGSNVVELPSADITPTPTIDFPSFVTLTAAVYAFTPTISSLRLLVNGDTTAGTNAPQKS